MYEGPEPDHRWRLDFLIVRQSDRPHVRNIAVHPVKGDITM